MDEPTTQPAVFPLYPNGATGSEHWDQEEEWSDIWWSDQPVLRNVSQPTLTAYLPDPAIAQGTGVILCPGGGWQFLAVAQEGIDVALWLNSIGIAAFVLKYRLIRTGDDYQEAQRKPDRARMTAAMAELRPLILNDGQSAVRMVRENADAWGVRPDRIGIMGYSAGGNVALNVALTHAADSRPDFVAAIYTAGWDDVPLPTDSAPLFILCTADDDMASANSIRLYGLYKAAGYPVELHIYSKGGHGFCLRQTGLPVDGWRQRFAEWLEANGFSQRRT
jgi:acetyl esterase/lipase